MNEKEAERADERMRDVLWKGHKGTLQTQNKRCQITGKKKRKYGTSQPLNKNKGSMEMRKERLMVCV